MDVVFWGRSHSLGGLLVFVFVFFHGWLFLTVSGCLGPYIQLFLGGVVWLRMVVLLGFIS